MVDVMECFCDYDGGEICQKDLKVIVQEFDKQGIGIVVEGVMLKLDWYKLMMGEMFYFMLECWVWVQGIFISDMLKGKFKFLSKFFGWYFSGFVCGQNIEEVLVNFIEVGWYLKVKVCGQCVVGMKVKDMCVEGVVIDKMVQCDCMFIILYDGEVMLQEFKKWVDWFLKQVVGQLVMVFIILLDWCDSVQKVWILNFVILVNDEWIDIEGDMLIKFVIFLWSDKGGMQVVFQFVDFCVMGGENLCGKILKVYVVLVDILL